MVEIAAGKRVALVVGNSGYAHEAALPNPRNDASDIADVLRRLGFSVRLGIDLTCEKFLKTVAEFARAAQGAEAALFYYAGHGLQVDGINYLVPIDAEIVVESDVRFNTQKLNDILDMMTRASQASLIILDACRNNPFTRSLKRSMAANRSSAVGAGLATVQLRADGEALIAYSTQPDNTAEDGAGQRNSPFTTALLRFIELPSLPVEDVLKRVGRAVKEATRGNQIPWYNSALYNEFKFNAQISAQPRPEDASYDHPWHLLKDSPNPGLIRSFIKNFPNDAYVADAKQRLGELEAAAWDKIRAAQTLSNIESFLSDYPDGRYADEARPTMVGLQNRAVGSLIALGLVTGIITGLPTQHSQLLFVLPGTPIGIWLPYGIFLFAGAVPFAVSRWWRQSWRAIAWFIGMTILGWLVAHISYQLMALGLGLKIDKMTALKITGANAEALTDLSQIEFFLLFVITAAASAIGAAMTIFGAGVESPSIRYSTVRPLTIFGAALAVGPEVFLAASGFSEEVAIMSLFVAWQVWVAGCIAWGHARGRDLRKPA